MKNLLLALVGMCLWVSCNNSETNVGAGIPAINQENIPPQIKKRIDNLAKVSEQTGLDQLMLNTNHTFTWKNLDAYYKKIDAMAQDDFVKSALKQKVILGMVTYFDLLKNAPQSTISFYAKELLVLPNGYEPRLMVRFMESLRGKWSATEMANAKQKTIQLTNKILENLEKGMARMDNYIKTNNGQTSDHELESYRQVKVKQLERQQEYILLKQQLTAQI